MPTPIVKRGPTRPYLSPPHLKLTPPDGGGYLPNGDDEEDKNTKAQEDNTMLDNTLEKIQENESEPTGTEVKEVPKCSKGMHW